MDAGVRLEQARCRLREVARVPSALERHLRVAALPAEPLRGDRARVTQVAVGDGVAYVIGLEDIILDRLAAFRHRRDEASREWAVQLLAVQWDRVDWEYLERQAASADWLAGEALGEARALAWRARAEAGLETGAP